MIERSEVLEMVLSAIKDVLKEEKKRMPKELGTSTHIFGKKAILDSLGLVSLIVDIEQRLEQEYDIILTLVDDRAMSQKNSPFRTVQSLTDYICLLIEGKKQDIDRT